MTVSTTVDVPNSVVLDSFQRELGDLWMQVAPLCRGAQDAGELASALHAGDASAGPHLVLELEALLAGWPHFDVGQRAVLTAAVGYVIEAPDGASRPTDECWVNDERVVAAAVRAILRHR